ncbi:hypothetical protein FKV68_24405 (plasmid) [Sinorhizobium mexicanum]|uniref:Uncharacterized protein n=1 Tax=Sinorhizobium mexicanum TaxID=375549 RepID=A0A859QYI9_9HYPH|nr:hypothetical protein FKV68_24405 [Sinorhizobium mexicanum]
MKGLDLNLPVALDALTGKLNLTAAARSINRRSARASRLCTCFQYVDDACRPQIEYQRSYTAAYRIALPAVVDMVTLFLSRRRSIRRPMFRKMTICRTPRMPVRIQHVDVWHPNNRFYRCCGKLHG